MEKGIYTIIFCAICQQTSRYPYCSAAAATAVTTPLVFFLSSLLLQIPAQKETPRVCPRCAFCTRRDVLQISCLLYLYTENKAIAHAQHTAFPQYSVCRHWRIIRKRKESTAFDDVSLRATSVLQALTACLHTQVFRQRMTVIFLPFGRHETRQNSAVRNLAKGVGTQRYVLSMHVCVRKESMW